MEQTKNLASFREWLENYRVKRALPVQSKDYRCCRTCGGEVGKWRRFCVPCGKQVAKEREQKRIEKRRMWQRRRALAPEYREKENARARLWRQRNPSPPGPCPDCGKPKERGCMRCSICRPLHEKKVRDEWLDRTRKEKREKDRSAIYRRADPEKFRARDYARYHRMRREQPAAYLRKMALKQHGRQRLTKKEQEWFQLFCATNQLNQPTK
jgi:hypothetical protein